MKFFRENGKIALHNAHTKVQSVIRNQTGAHTVDAQMPYP